MIGQSILCLDHGFVELVDVMGDDSRIARAARASYQNDGADKSQDDDRNLIRYLMRHWHTTPFEMVEFTFHMKLPIMVARQLIRHRTASVNEISARYTELPEEFYVPDAERIRSQTTTNKQGSSEFVLMESEGHRIGFQNEARENFRAYQERLAAGMAKELARNNLPLSTYTRWYWKMDLHNLFHFLRLRMDKHAQEEIRVYANAIVEFVRWRCPLACEAFEDYRLNAKTFSAQEMRLLLAMLDDPAEVKSMDPLRAALSKREMDEFKAKLNLF